MIKQVVKDIMFLSRPSQPAENTPETQQTVRDLLDTLAANREACVGMAANMIGVCRQIMVVNMGFIDFILINPVITKKENPYQTEEGCLSLTGVRPCTRYETIEVEYCDQHFNRYTRTFNGFVAQIIQHEMDHFQGIII